MPVLLADNLIKTIVKTRIQRLWREEWTYTDINKHTKNFFNTPNKNLSKCLLKMSRNDLMLLIPLITGHNFLRQFSDKLKPLANTNCRLCHETLENFLHLLNVCPRLRQQQTDCFYGYNFQPGDMDWNPMRLLKFCRIKEIYNLTLSPVNS